MTGAVYADPMAKPKAKAQNNKTDPGNFIAPSSHSPPHSPPHSSPHAPNASMDQWINGSMDQWIIRCELTQIH
jgi:hypothetical protein